MTTATLLDFLADQFADLADLHCEMGVLSQDDLAQLPIPDLRRLERELSAMASRVGAIVFAHDVECRKRAEAGAAGNS